MFTNENSYQIDLWTHLRESVYSESHLRTSNGFCAAIGCLMFAHIIAMVVHVAGGLKSAHGKERSLLLRDPQGFYHPTHHIAIPSAVILYAFGSCLAMSSFLYDHLSNTLRARSILLQCVGISLGLLVHWQQIVLVAYASPPTKFRFLQRASWTAALHNPRRHSLTSKQFNLVFGIGMLLPLSLPVLPTFLLYDCIRTTLLKGEIFNKLCLELIGLLRITSINAEDEISSSEKRNEALFQLGGLAKAPEAIWSLYQWTAGMYCIVVCLQSAVSIWVHIALLRRLFAHVKIVKGCWIQRQQLRSVLKLASEDVAFPPDSQQDAHFGTIDMKGSGTSNTSKASNSDFVDTWTDWLPSYKSPPDISQSDLPAVNKNNWVTKEESIMREQYVTLRAYATNHLWITVLVFIIELSSFLFTLSILLNWYGVPYRMNAIQTHGWSTVWANSIWGAGPGLFLGIVSNMVAFSPVPQLPKEPDKSRQPAESIRDSTSI